jgi:hypothetical protein
MQRLETLAATQNGSGSSGPGSDLEVKIFLLRFSNNFNIVKKKIKYFNTVFQLCFTFLTLEPHFIFICLLEKTKKNYLERYICALDILTNYISKYLDGTDNVNNLYRFGLGKKAAFTSNLQYSYTRLIKSQKGK